MSFAVIQYTTAACFACCAPIWAIEIIAICIVCFLQRRKYRIILEGNFC